MPGSAVGFIVVDITDAGSIYIVVPPEFNGGSIVTFGIVPITTGHIRISAVSNDTTMIIFKSRICLVENQGGLWIKLNKGDGTETMAS
jgi:hypothetical protein